MVGIALFDGFEEIKRNRFAVADEEGVLKVGCVENLPVEVTGGGASGLRVEVGETHSV